ncbi:MAG: hypothetical protein LUG51_00395 [Tannerellaceae bacterium]|nr:hypothetical protein [Tannerellaceae bacterium]
MIFIEEMGKMIAQLVADRNTAPPAQKLQVIQVIYGELKIDNSFLMTTSLEDIRHFLEGEDQAGLQRMEIAAKTLIEEGYLYPEKQREIHQRAKEILEYIQKNDTTFSFERITLIEELS